MFQKKTLALGLLTSVIVKFKHAREFEEKIAETRGFAGSSCLRTPTYCRRIERHRK